MFSDGNPLSVAGHRLVRGLAYPRVSYFLLVPCLVPKRARAFIAGSCWFASLGVFYHYYERAEEKTVSSRRSYAVKEWMLSMNGWNGTTLVRIQTEMQDGTSKTGIRIDQSI